MSEQEYMVNLVTGEVITVDEYDCRVLDDLKAWYETMDTAEYPTLDIFIDEMLKEPIKDNWELSDEFGNIIASE